MNDVLFQFEEGSVPPIVVLAAVTLVGLLGLGLGYKLLSVLVL